MRLPILFLAALAGLHAQATVEYGLGAGRAATMTAPAKDLGKSIAGAIGSLDKTLKNAKPASSAITVTGAAAAPAEPPKIYEDIKKAEVGMDYEALVARFGPASLEAAGEEGIRKLTYSDKDGTTRIDVKDGKVAAITSVKPQPQSSVLVLPK